MSALNPDLYNSPSKPLKDAESFAPDSDSLVGIDDVQKFLNRSRASVYRYTNSDPRNLNPPFNPRKLNPEFRSDQKDPLLFHSNEVARFAKDILRIKEVTVEVLNSPSTATQNILVSIHEELKLIRSNLEKMNNKEQQ
ncbi:putative Helix-turn-helix domain of resolvase [Prochlorococcus sp. MIT 0602]|nr:putative Helix-turn-helix domain of resolvase [Prochlorococcus sp. MIT 0602]KGG17076.1 putative Helix-turn-helix domain of resolvase [Prochlorococcus sp. MIT 0603]